MRTDRFGANVNIDWDHHLVHEGEMFILADEATGVAIATPKRWLFKVGAAPKGVHFRVGVAGTNGLKLELFEAPTSSADGTGVALIPANRVEQKTINATFFKDPTVSVDGTLVGVGRAGGGNFIQPGGQVESEIEYILKASTNYQIKATVTVDGTTVTLSGRCYEA